MTLPENYAWLEAYAADGPPMVDEALKLYGTYDAPGNADNTEIIGWANELGIKGYKHSDEPWCGLFMAYVTHQAKESSLPDQPLWALNWLHFGQQAPQGPFFGDVLCFKRRPAGGHVALYIAEDMSCYHVLGGNQSDAVTITRFMKSALVGWRRPFYKELQANVKKILVSPTGKPIEAKV